MGTHATTHSFLNMTQHTSPNNCAPATHRPASPLIARRQFERATCTSPS
jgi:hypothetical protein